MNKILTPGVRQAIYTLTALASALIPILVTLHVINGGLGTSLLNLVAVLGGLGAAGATTAAVYTSKQRQDGTFAFNGSSAEQAVAAIQATVAQANSVAVDLNTIVHALDVHPAVAPIPVAPPKFTVRDLCAEK